MEKSVPFDFSPEQPVSPCKWKTPMTSTADKTPDVMEYARLIILRVLLWYAPLRLVRKPRYSSEFEQNAMFEGSGSVAIFSTKHISMTTTRDHFSASKLLTRSVLLRSRANRRAVVKMPEENDAQK